MLNNKNMFAEYIRRLTGNKAMEQKEEMGRIREKVKKERVWTCISVAPKSLSSNNELQFFFIPPKKQNLCFL